MENAEKDLKSYEIAFLVKNEGEVPGVVSFLKQHNAEILAEPRAKNVVLAYEIKKNKEAVFAYCTFKAAGADVKNLEKDLSMGNLTIRSLIVSLPKNVGSRPEVSEERAQERKPKVSRPDAPAYSEVKLPSSRTLSNEALEKKIEEILK
jgi:ribosomal protein S6